MCTIVCLTADIEVPLSMPNNPNNFDAYIDGNTDETETSQTLKDTADINEGKQ